ncbi:hypothetical protein ABW20_dc0107300 [Dactylellina cionopaga]|nr:hypothetical protein ABW20_dc0107300 [Dactylellina cionopaga]
MDMGTAKGSNSSKRTKTTDNKEKDEEDEGDEERPEHVLHLDKFVGKKDRNIAEIHEHHATQINLRKNSDNYEDIHISYLIRPESTNFLANPHLTIPRDREKTPATYNFQAGSLTLEPPHGFSIHDKVVVSYYKKAPSTTLREVIASAETVRDAIKRIESTMKDYRSSLKVDIRELNRCYGESPQENTNRPLFHESAQIVVKRDLIRNQRYYTNHIQSMFEDLRKKEYHYRRNLECLNRQADDPALDPLAGIPQDRDERTEEQEIAYRGRLLTRAKLEKLGYNGGPVGPFLKYLNEEVWKGEVREAILAADYKVLAAVQQIEQEDSTRKGKRGQEIDFDGIDVLDLSALPWGKFKIKRRGVEGEKIADDGDTETPSKDVGKSVKLSPV